MYTGRICLLGTFGFRVNLLIPYPQRMVLVVSVYFTKETHFCFEIIIGSQKVAKKQNKTKKNTLYRAVP